MDSDHNRLVKLFEAAIEFDSPQAQARFIRKACEGDEMLLKRLDGLLQAHHKAGGFLSGKMPLGEDSQEHGVMERPGDRVGSYFLLANLGEGGFSTVFLAEQQEPVRRLVALKILKPGMDTHQIVSRFEIERQALAVMDHPGIAKVFDAGSTESGRPYFAMEWVQGTEITSFCDECALSISARLCLFSEVCEAIAHAHQKGIIHRDIKPSNILITQTNGCPHPRIIDFGIAKVLHTSQTGETAWTIRGRFIGTPAYMSPEQAQMTAESMDTRVDIYSLGALLYELLTGHPPFDNRTLLDAGLEGMFKIIREQEPLLPSIRLSHLPPRHCDKVAADRQSAPDALIRRLTSDLDWIAMKALEKDRNRRYQTVDSLRDDIQRHLKHEPVSAIAPTLTYRLGKLIRRNRNRCVAAAVTAGLLVIATLATVWQAAKAHRQGIIAKEHAEVAQVARQQVENSRIDVEVTRGMAASAIGEQDQALLWFGKAAADKGERFRVNAIRAQTWAANVPMPVRVFKVEPGIHSLSFSPNGRLLLAAEVQRQFYLWDWEANRALKWTDDVGPINASAWNNDGSVLALALASGEVQIRSLPDGNIVATFQEPEETLALCFSADGRYLAWGRTAVRLWDVKMSCFVEAECSHPQEVRAIVFSPQSDCLATVDDSGQARVFAVPQSGGSFRLLFGPVPHNYRMDGPTCAEGLKYREAAIHKGCILPPAFMNGGRLLATRSRTTELTCWRIDTGECSLRAVGTCCSSRFAVSSDGTRLASGIHGDGMRVWDPAADNSEVCTLQYGSCVLVTGFDSDGQTAITASADHTVRLWSLPSGKPVIPPLRHSTDVSHITVSPDDKILATAQTDGLIRIWRPSKTASFTQRLAHEYGAVVARLDPRGKKVVAAKEPAWGSRLTETRVYQVPGGAPASPILKFDGLLQDAVFAPDGNTLAVLLTPTDESSSGRIEFIEVGTGQQRMEPVPLPAVPASVAWHPGGNKVAAICQTGELLLLDLNGSALPLWLRQSPQPGSRLSPTVVFTASGDKSVSLTPDGRVEVWDTRTAAPGLIQQIRVAGLCWTFALTQDESLIATATTAGEVLVWQTESGTVAGPPLVHPAWVYSVKFSADGERLLTACHDGQVRLWNWRTGDLVCPSMIHGNQVYDAALTPDGLWAITACRDGNIRVWDCERGTAMTPPVPVGVQALHVEITPDGQFAAIGSLGDSMHLISLSFLYRETFWKPKSYRLLGQVASAHAIRGDRMEVLDTATWMECYKELQALRLEDAQDELQRAAGTGQSQSD